MTKATCAAVVKKFTDIPNVGPAMEKDFWFQGLREPADLKKYDGYDLYVRLCKGSGERHDPCVLDTFLAVVDFMKGAEAKPWWMYTEERKEKYPGI